MAERTSRGRGTPVVEGGWPDAHWAPVALWAVAVLALMAALMAAVHLRPGLRGALMEEDGPVEWASAIAFYAGFAVAAIGARAGPARDALLAFVAAFCLLATLDELSFGERLLGWSPPEVLGTRLDAAHDLLQIGKKAILTVTDRPYLAAAVLGGAALGAAAWGARALARRGVRLRPGSEGALLALAAAMLAVSQVPDLKLEALGSRVLGPLGAEEALELGAALAFLGFARLRTGAPGAAPAAARDRSSTIRASKAVPFSARWF